MLALDRVYVKVTPNLSLNAHSHTLPSLWAPKGMGGCCSGFLDSPWLYPHRHLVQHQRHPLLVLVCPPGEEGSVSAIRHHREEAVQVSVVTPVDDCR